MLIDPDRHELLDAPAWDEGRARGAVRAIVADVEASMDDDVTWPWHPQDRDGSDEPRHKSIYLGAAGVLWSLWALQRAGAVDLRQDPAALAPRLHRAYLAAPDTGQVVPSYFLGEVGILLVEWRLTGSGEAAERLRHAVRENIEHPANEALWAAPGTMLAALHLFRATGETRWRELYLDNVEQLWRTWTWRDDAGCFLWTQRLYGRVDELLGAAHGFAGNACALLAGADLLDEARRATLHERCAQVLQATADVEDGHANWRPSARDARGQAKRLVQWCHGAPGIVTALAGLPKDRFAAVDRLLLAAGETSWRAGPLAKGSGLCHGTAGNGYAFLKLHRRTGDAKWLERARAFAMHAIGQSESARRRHGQGRHSLWTGDPGVAMYLWSCITATCDLPLLDTVDPPSSAPVACQAT